MHIYLPESRFNGSLKLKVIPIFLRFRLQTVPARGDSHWRKRKRAIRLSVDGREERNLGSVSLRDILSV